MSRDIVSMARAMSTLMSRPKRDAEYDQRLQIGRDIGSQVVAALRAGESTTTPDLFMCATGLVMKAGDVEARGYFQALGEAIGGEL